MQQLILPTILLPAVLVAGSFGQPSLRGAASAPKDASTCYELYSDMEYNSLLQYFPSNPDSHMKGTVLCTACTNGTITCNAQVTAGITPLIASHIHLADDGDGAHGSGDPVISFCGDNSPGMINAAGPYPEPCAPWMDGRSNNKDMQSFFIQGTNHGMTMAERVQDIIRNPSKYYFNFHSKASWLHWSMQDPPTPKGTCRGVMKLSPNDMPSKPVCHELYSDMEYNSLLQYFSSNPDSHMKGTALCTACMDGNINCSAQVTDGMTPLIASHIHLADDGDGAHGSGDPVISFCGDNSPGMINAAGPYPEPCAPWMDGRSNNKDMQSFFIEGTNHGMTMAERVQDIIRNPSKYYFNFHSKASWLHWSMQDPPTPKGTCRGVMKASPYAADVVERSSPHDVLEIKLTSPGASDVSNSQEWMPLGGGSNHVADDEGKQVGELSTHSLSECKSACENNADCNSFAYCGNYCYLKDKSIEADAPEHYNQDCSTYYRPSERTCYQVFSDMAYNSLMQYFPSNPDSHMMGYAQCTACTDGAIWCDAQVTNGLTPLIASHIHLAEDGDGEHGSGEPVISFCGDNSPGMITDAGPYQEPCAPWMDSRSQNKNMRPFFIEGTNHGMTMAERVNDLIRYPSKYYFNFHSKASWLHWSMQDPPTPKGTCRGVMQLSPYH